MSEIKHEIIGIQIMKDRMKNLEQESGTTRNCNSYIFYVVIDLFSFKQKQ